MTQPLSAATGSSRKSQNHWVMKSMSGVADVGLSGCRGMPCALAPQLLSQRHHHRGGEHQAAGDGADQQCDEHRNAERAAQRGETQVQRNRLRIGSEEHTSELQSLMRISYAVFCLKQKTPTLQTYSLPILRQRHSN